MFPREFSVARRLGAASLFCLAVVVSPTRGLADTWDPNTYVMGNVVNGNFEAGGGSLTGWTASSWSPGDANVLVVGGNTWAYLHAQGQWWWSDWDSGWYYSGGSPAMIEQTVFIPTDANTLTFRYFTYNQEMPEAVGTAFVQVQLGNMNNPFTTTLTDANEWTTFQVSIDPSLRGRRAQLRFQAMDDYYPGVVSDPDPNMYNSVDLNVDYVGLDGTTVLRSIRWTAPGGGAWSVAQNWEPNAAPNNSTAFAYDVAVPVTATGPGDITVGGAIQVQTLDYARKAGKLALAAGASLTTLEGSTFTQAAVEVGPGATLASEANMTFYGGSLTTLPNPGGAAAQIYITPQFGVLLFAKDPNDPAAPGPVVQLTDAKMSGYNVEFRDSNVVLTNSSGFTGQTIIGGAGTSVAFYGSTVTLNPGTALGPRYNLTFDGNTTVYMNGATLGGTGDNMTNDVYVRRGSTLNVTGATTISMWWGMQNYGTVNFTDANVTLPDTGPWDYIQNHGTLRLVNSTLRVTSSVLDLTDSGNSRASLFADAASKLVLVNLQSLMTDANRFDLDEATVQFRQKGQYAPAKLSVQGMNAGPFQRGFDNNFGIGVLEVAQGQLQLLQWSSGRAQYVRSLVLDANTSLDLNGVKLYYLDSFTNLGGTVLNGQVVKAMPLPTGLPNVRLAGFSLTASANDSNVVDWDPNTLVTVQHTTHSISEYGWDATSSATSSMSNGGLWANVHLSIAGSAGGESADGSDPEPNSPDVLRAWASSAFHGHLSLDPTPEFPDGNAMSLLVVLGIDEYSSYSGTGMQDWHFRLLRDGTEIALFDSNHTEATVTAFSGETGLTLEGWAADDTNAYSSNSFSWTLDLNIYSTPEPATAGLLAVGAAVLLKHRKRRCPAAAASSPAARR